MKKKLTREQRRLSRKYESLKVNSKKQEGRATRQNIQKQVRKVQKLHQQLTNIRTDFIHKTVSSIVKRNPSYITIEDLNVRGMMKNRHLSKAVAAQKFYAFRELLESQCKANNIELRLVDRWYPSSKLCSCCGSYHKHFKLSDRVYHCNSCGLRIDRDLNASINLKNAKNIRLLNQTSAYICTVGYIGIYAFGVSYQMRVASAKSDTWKKEIISIWVCLSIF